MQLDIYFNTDPSKEQADRCRHTRLITGRPTIDVPGLAEQFGLPGLKPVIVLPSSALGGKYLLTDQTGAYFLWNELQPELWRFKFEGSTISLLEVITLVSTENYGNTDLVQQFNPDIAGRSRRAG
ncbi:hypothetical protein EDB81DRAFT_883702 [Dactylonectria macrodidyma]|uniref:Uncharacterized protein n=1 Tax=Dactylonectria macrodidyma TaxID=307937 RepID=A0A9P9J411_9HYPO|nr:hypothetical protein EDB81DRAFT_883702 [Dactylonectria macrodidyma]